MGSFLAGIAEVVITPPVGVDMAGYFDRKDPAQGVHDDLKAIAVVLDDRRQKCAICAVDLLAVKPMIVESVRKRIAYLISIPPECVMIAATHTHSGPKLNCDNRLNQAWLREVEDKIVWAIQQADVIRKEVRVGVACGTADGIGGNRRDPGKGPVDRSVQVMRIDEAETGKVMGVIVGHACHGTTLGIDNLQISADYPGQVRNYITANHPDKPLAMFLNGACGDVNPGGYSAEDAAMGKPIPNRTFKRAAEIGKLIGTEALQVLDSITTEDENHVQGGKRAVFLPMRKLKLPADADQEVEEARFKLEAAEKSGASEKEIERIWFEGFYARVHAWHSKLHFNDPCREVATEVQGIAVNDAVFVAFPGEVFTEIGYDLKEASPFPHTFVVAYANNDVGYFPTLDALHSGDGYEVKTSLFGDVAIKRITESAEMITQDLYKELDEYIESSRLPVKSALFCIPDHRIPPTEITQAKFPAIDFHLHYWLSNWHPVEEAINDMDKANVRICGNMIGDRFYQAKLEPILEHFKGYEDRFFFYTGVDFGRIDDPDWPEYVNQKLEHDIALGAKGIKIYKELGLRYIDSSGNLINADDDRLNPLWEAAARLALPVLYHHADPLPTFMPIDPSNERYDSLKGGNNRWYWGKPGGFPTYEEIMACMYNLAGKNPQTTFIFPHCASMTGDLLRCSALLDKYSNVYVDLSARLDLLGRQPNMARKFITKHSDRILWGTDQMWPDRYGCYSAWFRFLETEDDYFSYNSYGRPTKWRIYGINLPDKVLKKIYSENAVKLLKIKL
ncbi:MAG: neutral/alkaline non-lysosomal ceramidase N-terminal domain-containing protein [Planctomycetes bacterium]|nr:neutral/alkaline non-lysosomal ceramidase N-terminal domain-containing protein [Planctomycetota bacterium]